MNFADFNAGRRLRFWRKKNGMTQVDLAGNSGVAQSTLSRLESGEYTGRDKPVLLAQLARALNLDGDGFVLMNRDRLPYGVTALQPDDAATSAPPLSTIDAMAADVAQMVAEESPKARQELREQLALDSYNLMVISVEQMRKCSDKVTELLGMLANEPNFETREMLGDLVLKMAEIMCSASEETTVMNTYARAVEA